MPIDNKPKPCDGIGKAAGFEGCKKLHSNRKHGLCPSCLYDFLTSDERGKVIYQKSFLPKVSKKTEQRKKELTQIAKAKVTNWNKKLQDKVNEIVRIIDNGLPCLARNIYPNQIHAGHIYARGGNQSMRYNLHNIHRQSAQSNHYQNDDGLLREGVVSEYGQEYMNFISELRRTEPLKFKNEEYHMLYLKASQITNKLRKTITQPIPVAARLSLRNEINSQLGIYKEEYCVFNPPPKMITITNEDNMALMARYPDKHFDLAIADPPYGIGASEMTMGLGKKKWKKGKEWDNHPPSKEYFDELFRISKNQIIWGGNYFTNNLPVSRCWIFWDKDVRPDLSFAAGELAWCSFDEVVNKAPIDYSGFRGADKDGKIHPTQKPVKLYEWLLMNYAKEGDKILDTHLGSGSIAIACHNLGYELTACELDTDYYNSAMKRLEQHQSQLTMF